MALTKLDTYRTLGTHIAFRRWQGSDTLTRRWDVRSKEDANLGEIKWYPPWRKYCFFPAVSTLYEQVCLREIAEFIEQETAAHKAARKAAKHV